MKSSRVSSSLGGGAFYTAFNPTQPLWWATAGLALLLKGLEVMGIVGVILVTIGHWLSDFVYYIFVSFIVHKHASYVNPKQRQISIVLGIFMTALGIYFLEQGLQKLSWLRI
jgi:threonine/homoserine/homoserine lactone efflux protein